MDSESPQSYSELTHHCKQEKCCEALELGSVSSIRCQRNPSLQKHQNICRYLSFATLNHPWKCVLTKNIQFRNAYINSYKGWEKNVQSQLHLIFSPESFPLFNICLSLTDIYYGDYVTEDTVNSYRLRTLLPPFTSTHPY
ncbi:hypothetical protein NPIL_524481 [Nephila pilipes]|uniref:Uncharacterized protein n=1 Tax=Nephila pilipes TaxID=299642 RepID=A0A8X6QVW7_NEPPI|nr:hypothetical protein NPIL_524481 [Nephila pilipes]